MSTADSEDATEAAARRLRLLGDQADAVRAELSQLRADLAAAKTEFSQLRATQLAETGEMLVVAAAHADTVAQSAVTSLDELNLYSQLDELTGLPTRTLLLDRLEHSISAAHRRGNRFGVIFLDLDGFKQINDTHGHAAGDQILQVATQRLQSVVRESDTVSRHGGDEFILLIPEVSHAADLATVADKILAVLATPTQLAGEVLRMSASIGIAVFPEDGTDVSALLRHADAAMYRSKKRGRGRYEFHAGDQESGTAAPVQLPAVSLTRRTDAVFAEHEAHLHALRGANHELLEAARNDQKMRAHAEQAHRRQIDFVAMAAHAMRSPLSAVQLTVSMMKREAPGASAAPRRLETLERQSKNLARLIDDLLDGSLVGGGEFKLHCTNLPLDAVLDGSLVGGGEFKLHCTNLALDAVLDGAVEASRHALATKGQTLHVQRSSTNAAVLGDAMRVTQLFANLLKNASRRAPDGGSVRFSAEIDGAQVAFTVADTGAPIGAEALERIFELYTLDKSVPFDDAGLGIGLAVARELARAHGGAITARNAAGGEGSEFVVTLPCALPSCAEAGSGG